MGAHDIDPLIIERIELLGSAMGRLRLLAETYCDLELAGRSSGVTGAHVAAMKARVSLVAAAKVEEERVEETRQFIARIDELERQLTETQELVRSNIGDSVLIESASALPRKDSLPSDERH